MINNNSYQEVYKQIEDVELSNLTIQEKNAALKSHKTMTIVVVCFVLFITLLMGFGILCGFLLGGNIGVMLLISSMLFGILSLIIFAIVIRKFFFKDWVNAYKKVDLGFDGLSKQEINFLKPNEKEKKIIRKEKIKMFFLTMLFLFILIGGIIICFMLEHRLFAFIVLIIFSFIMWMKIDDCNVNIHRIESGYYKKDFGFMCSGCGNKVSINFVDLENYANSLPRDTNNIRYVKCRICGKNVSFPNYDMELKDYKKYLEKISY